MIAKTKAAGIASPHARSKGGSMLHEIPRISEAEFAGRNSGLETVASRLMVLNVGKVVHSLNFEENDRRHTHIYTFSNNVRGNTEV